MSKMRRLFTIAHPDLAPADAAFIDDFRAQYDAAQRARVAAHFTLVFGSTALPEADYIAHVRRRADATAAIDFRCRYAMLGADDESEMAYVFLVPDEGHAALSLLHDLLYTGPLAQLLRLDLPYTPHITIGRSNNRHEAKRWCEALNATGVDLRGRIHTLTVGAIEQGCFVALAHCPLNPGAVIGGPR